MMMTVVAGQCGGCRHRRTVRSDRGSTFVLCERSHTDRRFPRYPMLPVLACPGFEPLARTEPGEERKEADGAD